MIEINLSKILIHIVKEHDASPLVRAVDGADVVTDLHRNVALIGPNMLHKRNVKLQELIYRILGVGKLGFKDPHEVVVNQEGVRLRPPLPIDVEKINPRARQEFAPIEDRIALRHQALKVLDEFAFVGLTLRLLTLVPNLRPRRRLAGQAQACPLQTLDLPRHSARMPLGAHVYHLVQKIRWSLLTLFGRRRLQLLDARGGIVAAH